jgi:hypothetical protein
MADPLHKSSRKMLVMTLPLLCSILAGCPPRKPTPVVQQVDPPVEILHASPIAERFPEY